MFKVYHTRCGIFNSLSLVFYTLISFVKFYPLKKFGFSFIISCVNDGRNSVLFNMIIVDDELTAANELANLLDYNKYSFNVSGCFEDAESAVEFVEKNPVDLIISDIRMSDMSGIDLLKIINSRYPHIKVVLISAYRDFEYARLAVSYNAFEYITKPVSYTEYADVLLRVKEVLTKQNELFSDISGSLAEETLFDYLNDIISKESFVKKMSQFHFSQNILNSECCMAELKCRDMEEYLKTTWTHGKDRLQSAVKNIISGKLFDCLVFVMQSSDDLTKLIVISLKSEAKDFEFEKSLHDVFAYLKGELQNLLCMTTDITPLYKCESVFSLKNMLSDSTSYLANSIMVHIISGRFDKISELRDSFFAGASLEEQQRLCVQLSSSAKSTNYDKISVSEVNTINEITLKSISNSQTLMVYFDELIDSFKSTKNQNNFEKTVILKAIRYIDENYSKEITLSSVSKHVMLNTSYFSSFFKSQTGECFSDFLIKVRMEYAKDMLKKNPDIKVHTVCENVGYKSQPYFYKVFQAYTGYSPSEFKKLG